MMQIWVRLRLPSAIANIRIYCLVPGFKLKLLRVLNEDLQPGGRIMTLTQKWRYLNLTRNSFYILFHAKVSSITG